MGGNAKAWRCLVSLALFSLVAINFSTAGKCVPGKTPKDEGRVPPTISTKSFRNEMFGWSFTDNSNSELREHYSRESGRGASYYTSPTSFLFFLTNSDGSIRGTGSEDSCYMGGVPLTPTAFFNVTRAALDPDRITFVDNTEVSGIPATRWRTCLTLGDKENYTLSQPLEMSLDSYFSDGWEMYSGEDNVLLRIQLRLYQQDGSAVEHTVWDVTSFKNVEYDDDEFVADLEPPLGVECTGIEQTRQEPKIPGNSLTFKRESVNQIINYDDPFVDYEEIISDSYFEVLERKTLTATLVRDFYGGASYYMSRDNRETFCMITAVNNLRTEGGFKEENNYVTIDSVEEYFYLSGDFTYSGIYETRGIPCEVFTHVTDYYGTGEITASILLYYTKLGVRVETSTGYSENRLVKVEVRIKDFSTLTYNIYDLDIYDFEAAIEEPYDISSCFDTQNRIDFTLTFEVSEEDGVLTADQSRGLEHIVREKIAELTNIDVVRVQVGRAVQLNGAVGLAGKIFARPDSGTHFDTAIDQTLGSGDGVEARTLIVFNDVVNLESCAQYAEETDLAREADYCTYGSSKHKCTLYGPYIDGNSTLVSDPGCYHLTKIMGYKSRTSMGDAWDILQKNVYNKDFKITVEDRTYTAFSAKQTNNAKARLSSNSPLSQYIIYAGVELQKSNGGVFEKSLTLAECAEKCNRALVEPCQAFSYCSSQTLCELYGEYVYDQSVPSVNTDADRPPSMVEQDGCDTYVKSFLSGFSLQPGIAEKIPAAGLHPSFTDVDSPEVCAKLCVELEAIGSFMCESFDYCGSAQGTCFLRDYHTRTIFVDGAGAVGADGKSVTNCTFYSRNFIADYTRTEGVTSLPILTKVKNIDDPEACAYECSISDNCESFQFCESDKSCDFLDTSSRKAVEGITFKHGCFTYTEKEGADILSQSGSDKSVGDDKDDNDDDGTEYYSGAAMAGLAVAMLILGIGLFFLGFFAWAMLSKRVTRAESTNDLDMSNVAQKTI